MALDDYRPVAQLVEHRSPKPVVGGSSPSWPAIICKVLLRQVVRKGEVILYAYLKGIELSSCSAAQRAP